MATIEIQGRMIGRWIPFRLFRPMDNEKIEQAVDAAHDGDEIQFEGAFFLDSPPTLRGNRKVYNGQGKAVLYHTYDNSFPFIEGEHNYFCNFHLAHIDPNPIKRLFLWLFKGRPYAPRWKRMKHE